MKILLVEDDFKLSKNLSKILIKKGYVVDTALNYEKAIRLIYSEEYDIYILDVNLPDGSGVDLVKEIREESKSPILFLTAQSTKQDIVKGLNAGGDDYLPKPFDIEELLARVNALIRRNNSVEATDIFLKDYTINILNKTVFKNGEIIPLSLKEFTLLEYMVVNKNKYISKTELLEHVWGSNISVDDTNVVDVYIGYLRKKLDKKFIVTKRGLGYKINHT